MLSFSGSELGEEKSAATLASPLFEETLKDFKVDGQIAFGIFTDRFHQASGFDQHLVCIVVERRILQELACRTLPSGQFVRDG